MTVTKKELIESYKKLCKDRRKRKKCNYSWKECVGLFVCLMIFLIAAYVPIFKMNVFNIYPAIIAAIVMVIIALVIFLIFGYDETKIFYRENVAPDNWIEEFGIWLKTKGVYGRSEIDELLEWCSAVSDIRSPISKLIGRVEKMFSVFVIPAAIAYVFKLDESITDNNLKAKIDITLFVMAILMGLLVCVALPELDKFGNARIINDLRLELIEYKSFYRKNMYADVALKKTKAEE